jgi:hypothetical protein
MWAVITTLSNRIYLNMVAMAKHNASDHLSSPQTPTPSYSAPGRGTFPKATCTRSLALQARNSELFYSEYFEDQFSLEQFVDEAHGRVTG